MNNAEICYRCLEGVAFKQDGTNVAVDALTDTGVAIIQQRLSVFIPAAAVCNFYTSLKNTRRMLYCKNITAHQAIEKMRSGNYSNAEVRAAERLLDTIDGGLVVVEYMMVFIETHFADEVSTCLPSMSFSQLKQVLN